MSLTVTIVEDDPGVRETLSQWIDGADGFRCIGAYESAEEAIRSIPSNPPDVVLMDINLPRLSGVQCVRRLKHLLPKLQVVMLTVYEDSDRVFEALEAGATGYLLKRTPPDEILVSLAEVNRGGAPMSSFIARKVVQSFHRRGTASPEVAALSPREEEIVGLVAKGLHNKEIAAKLDIRTETVRVHLRNIYEKLQVNSRSEAVAKYLVPSAPRSALTAADEPSENTGGRRFDA